MTPDSPQRPSPHWLPWALGVAICVITLGAFHAVASFGFVKWDDDLNIYLNEHIRGLTPENLEWMFTDVSYARRYMPLGWLGWAINYQITGLSPGWFHAGNLLLHCVNALLLFALLRKVIAPQRATETPVLLACAAGALLWAIHPLTVESVAWASARIYNQAFFFALVSLLSYWRFANAEPSRRPWASLWISVACYAASLLTYPITLCFGLAPLILDIFPLKRFQREGGWWNEPNRRVLAEKLPYLGALALVLGVTLWARAHAAGIFDPPATLAEFSLLQRLMQAFYIWAYYVWKPWMPTDLAPIYSTLLDLRPFEPQFLTSAAGVIVLTALLLWKRRQWPGALTLWLTYLIVLVPLLGLTEARHYASDRYFYLTGILLSIAVAAGLVTLRRRSPVAFNSALALLFGVLGVFAVLTTRQARIWRDSDTFLRYTLAQLGDVYAAAPLHWRLGVILAEQGKNQEALISLREAVRLMPKLADAHGSLASVLAAEGRAAEAIASYREVLRLQPDAPQAMNNLAWILASHPDDKIRNGVEAVQLAERAAELTHRKHPVCLSTLAAAYAETGRFREAIEVAETARLIATMSKQPALATRNQELLELYRAGKPARQTQ